MEESDPAQASIGVDRRPAKTRVASLKKVARKPASHSAPGVARPLDILAGATPLRGGGWEQFYSLGQDPGLSAAGVKIGARVKLYKRKSPSLRIVFRAGREKREVTCVHVAVYAGLFDEMPDYEVMARSSEWHPVALAPAEHFFALKSYVAGIAEMGIGAMFAAARDVDPETLSVGFNDPMQQQVLECLLDLAPAGTLDLLQRAWGDPEDWPWFDYMREVFSRHPSTPAAVLYVLAQDSLRKIRQAVAEHPNSPPEALARLAEDDSDDIEILRAVAGHPNSPPEALARLATDEDRMIRLAVARHSHTPVEILTHLANDIDQIVTQAVASNKNTPVHTIAFLAGAKDNDVRVAIARNLRTPIEILSRFVLDQDDRVRLAVARCSRAPVTLLAHLASDNSEWVRLAVVEHKNTPAEIITRLAGDGSVKVQWAVKIRREILTLEKD